MPSHMCLNFCTFWTLQSIVPTGLVDQVCSSRSIRDQHADVPLDITKEGLNDDHDEDHQHKRGANHPLEVLR